AARGADEGGHLVAVERNADAFERPALPVIEIEISHRDLFGKAGGVDARMGDGRRHGEGRGRVHVHVDSFLVAASAPAMMLSSSTAKVMISAPLQASCCHSL